MAEPTKSDTTTRRASRTGTAQSVSGTSGAQPQTTNPGGTAGSTFANQGSRSAEAGQTDTGTQQTGTEHEESTFVGRVRDRAGERLSAQKDRASDGMQTMVQAVRDVTHRLRDDRHETMAEYVDRAAEQLERLSSQLRNKDVGELFRDAQNFARRRPAVFVGSAFAVGLLGARFLKSSPPDRPSGRPSWQRTPADRDLPAVTPDLARSGSYSRTPFEPDERIGMERR